MINLNLNAEFKYTSCPAGKIAEKAVLRSVFLTIWHRILNADSTKTLSSSVTFLAILPAGKSNNSIDQVRFGNVFSWKFFPKPKTRKFIQGVPKICPGHIWCVNDNLNYAHLHRLPQVGFATFFYWF